jgi:hypothetical protein
MATPSAGILTDPAAYKVDTIFFNGIETPGLAIVPAPPEPREWTDNNGFALNGPSTRFAGNRLATFDVTIVMWDPVVHLPLYARVAPLFQRPPLGKQAPKLTVVHPLLANAGIDMVVVTNHVGPYIDKQTYKGAFVSVISLKEYRVPLPMNPTPADGVRAMDGPKSATDILNDMVKAEGERFEKNAAIASGAKK